MFDWLWKGVAGLAGLAALWFGTLAAHRKRKAEREKANQEEAMREMQELAYQQMKEQRRKQAAEPAPNAKDRREFER